MAGRETIHKAEPVSMTEAEVRAMGTDEERPMHVLQRLQAGHLSRPPESVTSSKRHPIPVSREEMEELQQTGMVPEAVRRRLEEAASTTRGLARRQREAEKEFPRVEPPR